MLCHVGEAGICTCWSLPIYYIYIYVLLAYVYFDVFINVFKTPFRFSPTHQYLESTSTGYLVHAVCVMQFSIRKFGAFYFWKILLFVSAGHFVANQFVLSSGSSASLLVLQFRNRRFSLVFRVLVVFQRDSSLQGSAAPRCLLQLGENLSIVEVFGLFGMNFQQFFVRPCLHVFHAFLKTIFHLHRCYRHLSATLGIEAFCRTSNRATNMGTFSMVTWWTKSDTAHLTPVCWYLQLKYSLIARHPQAALVYSYSPISSRGHVFTSGWMDFVDHQQHGHCINWFCPSTEFPAK